MTSASAETKRVRIIRIIGIDKSIHYAYLYRSQAVNEPANSLTRYHREAVANLLILLDRTSCS
jgi:hypothetical protein